MNFIRTGVLRMLLLHICYNLTFGQEWTLNSESKRNIYNGCFGELISASCDDNTDIIAVQDVFIGAKRKTENCPERFERDTDSAQCCEYMNATDCRFDFEVDHFHTFCNGRSACTPIGLSRLVVTSDTCGAGYETIYGLYTTFTNLYYYCIESTRVASMCTNVSLSTSSSDILYIHNNNYPTAINPTDNGCSCSVEVNDCDAYIRMHSVHLHLSGGNDACEQSILLMDGDTLNNVTCDQNSEYNIVTKKTSSSYITLTLLNTASVATGNFWYGFQASATGLELVISCPAQPQQYLCITTTTSTTTPTAQTEAPTTQTESPTSQTEAPTTQTESPTTEINDAELTIIVVTVTTIVVVILIVCVSCVCFLKGRDDPEVKQNKVNTSDIERNTANYIMTGAVSSNNKDTAPSTTTNTNGKTDKNQENENKVLALTNHNLLQNSNFSKGKIRGKDYAKTSPSNGISIKLIKSKGADKTDLPGPILRPMPPDLQTMFESKFVNLNSNDVSIEKEKENKKKNASSIFAIASAIDSPKVTNKVENGLNNTLSRVREPTDKIRLKPASAITTKYKVKKPSSPKLQAISLKSKPKLRRKRFRSGKVTSTSSVGTQSDISSFVNIDFMESLRGNSQPLSILWNETLPEFISAIPGNREGHDSEDDNITVVTNKTASTTTRRKIKHKRSVAKTHWTNSKF